MRVKKQQRAFRNTLHIAFGRCVNEVAEGTRGKFERPNIAFVKRDCGMCSEMRRFVAKRRGIASQHHDFRVQGELVVCARETLEQPTSEEAGSAGDENSCRAQLFPELTCVAKDMVEINPERVLASRNLHHPFAQKA